MKWRQRLHLRYQGWLLHSLARTTFWSDKFKQRFTHLGLWLLLALLLSLMFGSNTKLSMIYQLFSVLLALLLVALMMAVLQRFSVKQKVQLFRELPLFATVGEPFSYLIRVRNLTNDDLFRIRISERFNPAMPSLFQFLNKEEPDERQRNWYDRQVGYYRFLWLQHWLHGAELEADIVAHLKANSEQTLKMSTTALRRGYIHFMALRAGFPEPLGLVYTFQTSEMYQSLLVLPKRYNIPATIALSAKQLYQQGGFALASHVGDSEEFNRLREYRAGDSPRHVYWPSLARSGKLLVKEFQDEHFTRQALILDNYADAGKEQALEEAISVAAGFATAIDTGDALLDLMFVGDASHIEAMTAGRALAHADQMLEALATLRACPDAEFKRLGQAVIQQADLFASCVLVLLSWDETRQELVAQLLAHLVTVRVFLILDKDEKDPELAVMAEYDSAFHVLRSGQVQQNLDGIDAA